MLLTAQQNTVKQYEPGQIQNMWYDEDHYWIHDIYKELKGKTANQPFSLQNSVFLLITSLSNQINV